MGFDENIEMVRLAFYQVLISSGPFLAAALAIGLIIGILQAATSIQEMTLSYIPKMAAVVVVLFFSFSFMLQFMVVFMINIFNAISSI